MKAISMQCCRTTLIAVLGVAASGADTPDPAAALDANKRLVMRYYDAALNGRYEEIDTIFAENYVRHDNSELVSKAPPQSELARRLHRHVPDQRGTFDVVIGEGDLVAVRWRLQGHPGELPIKIMRTLVGRTGPLTTTGVNIFRVKDGRIVENWNSRDDLALRTQLGVFRWYVVGGFVLGVLVAMVAGRLRRRAAASSMAAS